MILVMREGGGHTLKSRIYIGKLDMYFRNAQVMAIRATWLNF